MEVVQEFYSSVRDPGDKHHVLGQERGNAVVSKRVWLGDFWTTEGHGCCFHVRVAGRAQGSVSLAQSRELCRFYSSWQLGAY